MDSLSRRRFLVSAASGGLALAAAGTLTAPARAATEDELAFASFGAATELLLQDFYARAGDAKLLTGALRTAFARGEVAAREHVVALSTLLTDAGQAAPLAEDFEFAWPARTFTTKKAAATAGSTIARSLRGAYLTGAATSPTLSFRVLYASLASSVGEQAAAFSLARGRPAIGNSFPTALELEAASAAVESFLG